MAHSSHPSVVRRHAYVVGLAAIAIIGCGSSGDNTNTPAPGADSGMNGGGMDAMASDSSTPPGRDAGDAHTPSPDSSTRDSSSSDSGHVTVVNVDVCTVMNGTVAWVDSIPAASPSLALSDVVVGPTNDVVVSDEAGGTSYDLHRWDTKGTVVSLHSDPLGGYTGPLWTSNLIMDGQNDVFYGTLMTGLVQGANSSAQLTFTRLPATGSPIVSPTITNSMPTASGPPTVNVFGAGFDSGGGYHGALSMAAPQYFPAGVYCYGSSLSSEATSAQNVTGTLTAQDFEWPTIDAGLFVTKPVTSNIDMGCGTVTVPAGGGVILAKLDGGGGCMWNRLLALPTQAVRSTYFRLGADGTTALAVVYAGSIDFGGGPLVNQGTTSLGVARFDAGGTLLWTKNFGGAGSDLTLGSLGINGDGVLMLTAGYTGTVDVGSGPLPANADTFLAVLDATGNFKWAKAVTVGPQGGLKAAVGKCGVAVATNSPTVDFGTGPLSSVTPPMAATIGVAALGL